jgi:hypothetical protein
LSTRNYPAANWNADNLFTSSHILCPLGTFTLTAFADEPLTGIANSKVTIDVNNLVIQTHTFPDKLEQYKVNLRCTSTGLNGQSAVTVLLIQITKKACLSTGKANSADILYSSAFFVSPASTKFSV